LTDGPVSEGVEPPGLGAIWLGVLLGPLVWLADLELCLAYTRTAADSSQRWPLVVFALVALALALFGARLSHRQWRHLGALVERGRADLQAARAVAGWGLCFSLFAALLIAAMAVPTFVFDPRDLP
jgi:hypothetical protein